MFSITTKPLRTVWRAEERRSACCDVCTFDQPGKAMTSRKPANVTRNSLGSLRIVVAPLSQRPLCLAASCYGSSCDLAVSP